MSVFYEAQEVPVHSVLLMPTREEALSYPRGTITLGFCPACGFISNTSFDPRLHEYSSRYEETQGFSPTFNTFHKSLARRLIDTYDLHNKDIIEIGCGKGEFLTMLCEMGNNRGVGIDPAYVPERNTSPAKNRITFIRDLYSEKYTDLRGNLIVCKMTLEHIQPVYEFVGMVRRSIGTKMDATIFFQIPNAAYVLRELAFWDIYYEHCSYFTADSLARLFRKGGFDVLSVSAEYDDQYLTIEARPGKKEVPGPNIGALDDTTALVRNFVEQYPLRLQQWKSLVSSIRDRDRKAVIWGAGSKGVAFLTKLNITHDVMPYAVDINPFKQGTFMAGTGQEIVMPGFLATYKPDVVIIMNPVYKQEVQKGLDDMGLRCETVTM